MSKKVFHIVRTQNGFYSIRSTHFRDVLTDEVLKKTKFNTLADAYHGLQAMKLAFMLGSWHDVDAEVKETGDA